MDFTEMIENEWKNFESFMLSKKSKFEIFNYSWKISELQQFYSYFCEFGAMDMSAKLLELLQKYCEATYKEGKFEILDNIYGFECGYNVAQWVTFAEIHDMLEIFLTEWDTYDEDNNRREKDI